MSGHCTPQSIRAFLVLCVRQRRRGKDPNLCRDLAYDEAGEADDLHLKSSLCHYSKKRVRGEFLEACSGENKHSVWLYGRYQIMRLARGGVTFID